MSSSSAARRHKRSPTPPPSPKILHLPRLHRRRQHESPKTRERFPLVLPDSSRRKKVEEDKDNWRFEADMLREECNVLRTEKESLVMELQKNRATLHSALQFLGKKKINEEHKENELEEADMDDFENLPRPNVTNSKSETKNCTNSFDNKAYILRQRLMKFGKAKKEKYAIDINEPEAKINSNNKYFDVEDLRRKMEGISSKGVYERMQEEYGSMLVSNAHTPHASASSSKRFEFIDDSSLTTRVSNQEPGKRKCSGECKIIVRRIMEQVKEESKQWSEMQEMLGRVRKEMDLIKSSRDFWHNQALESENQIHTLHSTVQEWKAKALGYKIKANGLKREVSAFKEELENYRDSQNREYTRTRTDSNIISLGAHIAKEKRAMASRLKQKENYCQINQEILDNDGRSKSQVSDRDGIGSSKRLPFQNIGNASLAKGKQNGKALYHSYEKC